LPSFEVGVGKFVSCKLTVEVKASCNWYNVWSYRRRSCYVI